MLMRYHSPVREKDRIVPGSTLEEKEPFAGVGNRPLRLPTADPLLRVFSFGLHHTGQCKQQRYAWRVLLVARSATAHKWAAKIAPMTERLSGVVAPSEDDSRTHRLG